jgi:hypothetical protein
MRSKVREMQRTPQLSLGSAAILGRRERKRLEESVRMTRENTWKRMGEKGKGREETWSSY